MIGAGLQGVKERNILDLLRLIRVLHISGSTSPFKFLTREGGMMKIRSSALYVALIAGLGLTLTGCGKLNDVRAMKAFKDGNKLYAGQDWRQAAEKYEEAIALDP